MRAWSKWLGTAEVAAFADTLRAELRPALRGEPAPKTIAQEYAAEAQSAEPSPDVRAMMEAGVERDTAEALAKPQVRAAVEAELAEVGRHREAYVGALNGAQQFAQAAFFEAVPELAGLPLAQIEQGLAMLQQVDPPRFQAAMNTLNRVGQIAQAQQQAQHQQAQIAHQQFESQRQQFSRASDEALGMSHAEKAEMAEDLVSYVGEFGISREQLVHEARTNLALHHPAFQKMAADALKYQRLMKTKAVPTRDVPRVMRPGTSQTPAERQASSVDASVPACGADFLCRALFTAHRTCQPSIIEIRRRTPMAAGFEPGQHQEPFRISTMSKFDALEVMTAAPKAAERLRTLRQRFNDMNVLVPKFQEIKEASDALVVAEQRLARLQAPRSEGGFGYHETDARVREQLKQVTKLSDEFKRINERREARSASWTSVSLVVSACETWLRDGRPGGTTLADFDGPEPKLIKSETIVDGIERLRRRCREIKAAIHTIESAPFPSVNAKQKMRAQIEALAQIGQPDVSDLIENDRPVTFPMQRVQSDVVGIEMTAFAFAQVPDTVAMFAWLHKDAIIKKLDAEIDAVADDAAALSSEERAKRLAEAQGDLLSVERDESCVGVASDRAKACRSSTAPTPAQQQSSNAWQSPRPSTATGRIEHRIMSFDIIGGGGGDDFQIVAHRGGFHLPALQRAARSSGNPRFSPPPLPRTALPGMELGGAMAGRLRWRRGVLSGGLFTAVGSSPNPIGDRARRGWHVFQAVACRPVIECGAGVRFFLSVGRLARAAIGDHLAAWICR